MTETLTAPPEQTGIILPNGLAAETAEAIRLKFDPFKAQADAWMDQAKAIEVKDIHDDAGMKMARSSRLAAVKLRSNIEKTRKAAKEDALIYGRTVDSIAKDLTESMLAIEAELKKKEEYAERMEAERLAALRAERRKKLEALIPVPDYIELEKLTEEQFAEMMARAERQVAFEKAEAERIAREAEEKRVADEKAAEEAARLEAERKAEEEAERERQKAELARLKAEMAEQAEKARKEREAAEEAARAERDRLLAERKEADKKAAEEYAAAQAKARAAEAAARKERDAREKLEREAAERKAAEEARVAQEKAEAEEAARKAAAAPDADRLRAFAETVRLLDRPKHAATLDGEAVMKEVGAKTEAFAKWIETKATELQ